MNKKKKKLTDENDAGSVLQVSISSLNESVNIVSSNKGYTLDTICNRAIKLLGKVRDERK